METYNTSIKNLAKELGVSMSDATGFINVMKKCYMAKKVGHVDGGEGRGRRAAVFEVQKNVEIFTLNEVEFNPLKEKKAKKAKAETAEASAETEAAEDTEMTETAEVNTPEVPEIPEVPEVTAEADSEATFEASDEEATEVKESVETA